VKNARIAVIAACCREPQRPQPGQLAVRGPHDQHVRCARILLCEPGVGVGQVDRGLVGGQHWLFLQGGLHRLVEPGVLQPGRQPLAGKIDEPGRDGHVEQLSDASRRSSSSTLSSSRRYRCSWASSSARSTAFSASLASITARSRATSSR
jgi:hypothetical protein